MNFAHVDNAYGPGDDGGITAFHDCDVCGVAIERDYRSAASSSPDGTAPTPVWLGVCACPNRRWRWHDAPWALLG